MAIDGYPGRQASMDKPAVNPHPQTSQDCEIKLQASQARIRVGLLLDDRFVPRWIHETIEQLLCAEHVEVFLIDFNCRPRAQRLQPRSMLFVLWRRFDKWTFSKNDDPLARELKTYPIPVITLTPVEGTGKRTLSDRDVARLRECNLDVLVDVGSGDLPDEFLNCAEYGVWAFSYGGDTEAAGEVALFRNLNAGRSTYELILRAATGNPRRNWVLGRHIFFIHLFSLEYNLALDCRRRTHILLQHLSDLYRKGWSSIVMGNIDADAIEMRSDSASLNRATVSWFIRSLRRLVTKICFRQQWCFAYCKMNSRADTEQIISDSLRIVLPPRGQLYADPFPLVHNGKTYIFFEHVEDGRGTICCAELHADGMLGETQRVLTRNYHLSYPFVFEWSGHIYLLPETLDQRTVEIYCAIDFPQRWELAAVLLRNVTAVDPTIVEHNGKLWLFVAGLGGPGTEWSELSLFFADSLFGKWHPHPKNPIVRDLRSARPAGRFFFRQGILIRPGQDCSECYGYAISLNRVEILSETDYKETPLTTIPPSWMPGLCATHTFNQQNGITVLDGLIRIPRWVPVKRSLCSFRAGSRFNGAVLSVHPGSRGKADMTAL